MSARPKQRRIPSIPGESYREIDLMVSGLIASEGGWYYGRRWLTRAHVEEAEKRWIKRLYATSPKDDDDWVEHQCGGCFFFAALDSDWGLCLNERSHNDGRLTFEHTGCEHHSDLESPEPLAIGPTEIGGATSTQEDSRG